MNETPRPDTGGKNQKKFWKSHHPNGGGGWEGVAGNSLDRKQRINNKDPGIQNSYSCDRARLLARLQCVYIISYYKSANCDTSRLAKTIGTTSMSKAHTTHTHTHTNTHIHTHTNTHIRIHTHNHTQTHTHTHTHTSTQAHTHTHTHILALCSVGARHVVMTAKIWQHPPISIGLAGLPGWPFRCQK